MSSIAKGGVLKPESQWNTELILELCKIEQAAMVAAGEVKKLSIVYHIEKKGDLIMPVNICNQATEDVHDENTIYVTFVKLLKDNGHVYLVTDVVDDKGVSFLPDYLRQLDRSLYISFFRDQNRFNVQHNSHMISVFDVKHFKSNHLREEVSFWDAVARHVTQDYVENSWETNVHRQFLIKQNTSQKSGGKFRNISINISIFSCLNIQITVLM